jgi:hypothetical protein
LKHRYAKKIIFFLFRSACLSLYPTWNHIDRKQTPTRASLQIFYVMKPFLQ